jgi:SWI/SNF-related matrix-associated actin-dependent regulator 1 of chromatin subfamily A
LLLTGTPVENNAQELLTLLSFLAPKLFAHAGSKGTQLAALFRGLDKCAEEERGPRVAKVQRLMRPFVLRRLKADVLLELPPKTEEVARVPMPAGQRAIYDETLTRIARENQTRLELWAQRKQGDEHAGRLGGELAEAAGQRESGSGLEGGSWIASAFTELRKAAQHPLLLQRHYRDQLPKVAHALWCEGHFGDKCSEDTVLEHVKSMSDLDIHLSCKSYSALRSLCLPAAAFFASAKAAKLAAMLPTLFEQGHRALIFSQVRRNSSEMGDGGSGRSREGDGGRREVRRH